MCFYEEILILKIDVAAYLDINNIFSILFKAHQSPQSMSNG